MVQASVALQVMVSSHESAPQVTVQAEPPHSIGGPHDCPPVHTIVQLAASPQSMPWVQVLIPVQLTVHGTPAGHTISAPWHSLG
jgi:hypothetical protein